MTDIRGDGERPRLLDPLGIPDYRRLLIGNGLWWQAMWMELLVVGWLVLELTDSPWLVALVTFYRAVPLLIWGFVSGAVIDRMGQRGIILICQSITLAAYTCVGLLIWSGQVAYWQLCLLSFVLGSAWAFDWPARRSYMPDLVGKTRTVDAMMLEAFVQMVSRILGPFSAGLLLDTFGASGCYAVLVALSGVTLAILLGMSVPAAREDAPKAWTPIRDVMEGFRYVRGNQAILGTFLITLIMNNLAFPYMTLLPVFARDVLGQGPTGLGILGAGNGIGSLFGLLIIKALRGKVSNGLIFTGGSALFAVTLFAFANSTLFELSLALLIIAGIGQAAFGMMQSSIVLTNSSDEMRSRAMGCLVIAIGTGPAGRLQVGALAETFGAPMAVAVQAAPCALVVLALMVFMPGLRRVREPDPTEDGREPFVSTGS